VCTSRARFPSASQLASTFLHSIDDTLRPWCAFDLSFVHADDRYVTPSGAGIKTGETTQTILSLCLLCSLHIVSFAFQRWRARFAR
jgi:hypothetical protein